MEKKQKSSKLNYIILKVISDGSSAMFYVGLIIICYMISHLIKSLPIDRREIFPPLIPLSILLVAPFISKIITGYLNASQKLNTLPQDAEHTLINKKTLTKEEAKSNNIQDILSIEEKKLTNISKKSISRLEKEI